MFYSRQEPNNDTKCFQQQTYQPSFESDGVDVELLHEPYFVVHVFQETQHLKKVEKNIDLTNFHRRRKLRAALIITVSNGEAGATGCWHHLTLPSSLHNRLHFKKNR